MAPEGYKTQCKTQEWIANGSRKDGLEGSSTKGNNVENNPKQRNQQKQIGGITGRSFTPGKSGNPNGRPHSRGLITALRLKVAEIAPDGRTLEEHLIDVWLQEALRGKHRLPAVELIFDRLEGRARQQIEVADITRELREKSLPSPTNFTTHDPSCRIIARSGKPCGRDSMQVKKSNSGSTMRWSRPCAARMLPLYLCMNSNGWSGNFRRSAGRLKSRNLANSDSHILSKCISG